MVVFKDDLDHDCVDLPIEDRVVVSVITVAAPCWPALTPDGQAFLYEQDVNNLRGKIRLILRIAAHNGQDRLILGEFAQQLSWLHRDDKHQMQWGAGRMAALPNL